MILPFLIFWVLIFLGKNELGLKGVLISIAIWGGLLLGFAMLNISPYLFVVAQVILDIILILVIFGGDIRIR
ncbi:MAG: hypothetical protein JW806_01540 [Sedimentisphaerales bacterium]|nr:hypothetical protein [Sedimentisphaerales bacterium]